MDQQSMFEKSVARSCETASHPDHRYYQFYEASYQQLLGLISFCLSLLTAIIIFCDRRNWITYPQKYLGLICLALVSNYQMELLLFENICKEDDWFVDLVSNTLVTKWSRFGRYLGFHLFDLSRWHVKGMLMYSRITICIISSECEVLLGMALNLDVGLTVLNSYKRSNFLRQILSALRFSFFLTFVFMIIALSRTLYKIHISKPD
jgi:hypothetical protein